MERDPEGNANQVKRMPDHLLDRYSTGLLVSGADLDLTRSLVHYKYGTAWRVANRRAKRTPIGRGFPCMAYRGSARRQGKQDVDERNSVCSQTVA